MEAGGRNAATWIGYGGALGGGKSAAIRRVMLARRLQHPKTKGVIIRRVFKDLKENHIDMFWSEYPALRQWYTEKNGIVLPNGSVIGFMHAENRNDVDRQFAGPEYGDIFVDQAEQFSEGELFKINSRARWPGKPDGFCKFGLFFNPGGIGTEFLRRVFWLKQFKGGERPEDFAFIQAYGWDNYMWAMGAGELSEREYYAMDDVARFEYFINQTQYGRKLNAYPKSLRDGLLLGSFEKFAGQYYSGVWDDQTCVLTRAQLERLVKLWWTRWIGLDWGFGHNSACIWFTRGKVSPGDFSAVFGKQVPYPVDLVIAYRELVVSETPEEDLARRIADMTPLAERPLVQRIFLSPDAVALKSAHTIQERMDAEWRKAGLVGSEEADWDRIGGWRLMYSGFKATGSIMAETPVQEPDQPVLMVSAECAEVIMAIPLLARDPDNLEDVLKTNTVADDVADGFRYGYKSMLENSRKPRAVEQQEVYDSYQDMTAKAMAMRRFEAQHPAQRRIGKPRAR